MYISENCIWTPYGTDPELDEEINSGDWVVRRKVASQGYGLDKLINDEHDDVRYEVVKQGYGLDIFINDKDWLIRALVAYQGYGLDKLVNDRVSNVRYAVAEQGYGLDILINDEEWTVREAVAKQGYGLDILINDKNEFVRVKVAHQGYGLDKLINDKNYRVRCEVKNYLKENKLTLKQWIVQNSDKCVLKHNEVEVTKDFIYKIDGSNKLEVQSQYDSIDEFFNSGVEDDIKMNTLVVCSVDTKIPLFEIEKVQIEIIEYKFIVDITNEQGDDFRVRTVIQSREQLDKLIQQTIDALNLYPQFSNYADELENCL